MRAAWALLAAAALLSVACTTTAASARHTIRAAGATFPASVYEAWTYGYSHVDETVVFTYDPVGSGGGVSALNDRTAAFAATDSATLVGNVTHGDGMLIPFLVGAVVLAYSVPFTSGQGPLVLDGPTLVSIFNGSITTWDDAAIQALNPGIGLPALAITLVVRSDSSGSTDIFTTALAALSDGTWTARGPLPTWPAPVTKRYENAGVAVTVREISGAIGYCGVSYATEFQVPYAQMINRAGNVVNATLDSLASAVADFSGTFDANFTAVIVDGPGALSWPIAGYTYIVLRRTTMTDCTDALYIAQFLRWVSTDAHAITGQYGFLATVVVQGANTTERIWEAINQLQCKGAYVTQQFFDYEVAYYITMGVLLVFVFANAVLQTIYHHSSFLRGTSVFPLWCSSAGAFVLLASIYVWNHITESTKCHLQIWMTAVGTSLLIGSFWAKATRPWQYVRGYSVQMPPNGKRLGVSVSILVAIDVIVCIIWSTAGKVQSNQLYQCTTNDFWGYFGFFLAYKGIIVLWTIIESLNVPPSRSYFGATLYFVQAFSAVVILVVLFLPVIFLVPFSPNDPARQLFSPSALIILSVVVLMSIITLHKVVLRFAVIKARAALRAKANGLSSGATGSSHDTSSHSPSDVSDEIALGGVTGAVIAAAERNNSKEDSIPLAVVGPSDIEEGAARSPRDFETFNVPKTLSTGSIAFVAENEAKEPPQMLVDITAVPASTTPAPAHDHSTPLEHAPASGVLLGKAKAKGAGTKKTKKDGETTREGKQRSQLEKLMRRPVARLQFRNILTRLRCVEVMDFYLASCEYRETADPQQREELAKTIYSLYVQPGCANELNLIYKTQQDLQHKIGKLIEARGGEQANLDKSPVDASLVAPELFDAAIKEALDLMQGIYVENMSIARHQVA
eukprot:Unigene2261_Nuclearia_a/m.7017 Unigene2261_Nuclearia_a/g.7017  ORF Unigene2261_Nuclearia_a/g.7017 Unigene2261_Nuclearia_a/m.7017 type:complete len:908 (-) Unigene2261_Nuclearia_a:283-3006(-)